MGGKWLNETHTGTEKNVPTHWLSPSIWYCRLCCKDSWNIIPVYTISLPGCSTTKFGRFQECVCRGGILILYQMALIIYLMHSLGCHFRNTHAKLYLTFFGLSGAWDKNFLRRFCFLSLFLLLCKNKNFVPFSCFLFTSPIASISGSCTNLVSIFYTQQRSISPSWSYIIAPYRVNISTVIL